MQIELAGQKLLEDEQRKKHVLEEQARARDLSSPVLTGRFVAFRHL